METAALGTEPELHKAGGVPSNLIVETTPAGRDDNSGGDASSDVSSLRDSNTVVVKRLLLQRRAEQQLKQQQRRLQTGVPEGEEAVAQKSDRKNEEELDDILEFLSCGDQQQRRPPLRLGTLHGRQKEIRMLQASYDRVACTGRSEAILLKGKSGSGKS
eukprot:CAMPEP_0194040086 /NCGR_PEP_ID=MMETSP0009_2-20130614/12153_1 /TAXON_ID=210454 /ORGANISM="Grammatophora oceanica, Strain CCMP 410" /LENGTH=158 /DNA_ID=CAMNT_0038683121 /DNA_START=33 /DNA_END=506 /DNA_ORIENTATION=-